MLVKLKTVEVIGDEEIYDSQKREGKTCCNLERRDLLVPVFSTQYVHKPREQETYCALSERSDYSKYKGQVINEDSHGSLDDKQDDDHSIVERIRSPFTDPLFFLFLSQF